MYDLMIYSLKVGVCLAVFYLFFKLLLSRETFHRFNRIVVLGAMFLSFVLPLCVITVYREIPVLPEIPDGEAVATAFAEPLSEPFPWEMLAGAAFLLGAAATLLWTLCSLIGVLRLIRGGRRERLEDGAVLVRTERPVTPFSWGRYIVMSERDLAENGGAILLHERAHPAAPFARPDRDRRCGLPAMVQPRDVAAAPRTAGHPRIRSRRGGARQRRRRPELPDVVNKESCRREVVLDCQQL